MLETKGYQGSDEDRHWLGHIETKDGNDWMKSVKCFEVKDKVSVCRARKT